MWQTLEALVSAKNFLNTRAEHEAMEPCLSNTVDSYINFSSSQYLSIWWHSFQYLLQDASFPTPLLSANFPFIYRNAREHISHPWWEEVQIQCQVHVSRLSEKPRASSNPFVKLLGFLFCNASLEILILLGVHGMVLAGGCRAPLRGCPMPDTVTSSCLQHPHHRAWLGLAAMGGHLWENLQEKG